MAEAARSSGPQANLAQNDGEGLHRSSMEGKPLLLPEERKERFREEAREGSRERERKQNMGFLPASWRNSGEARRAAG